MEPIDLKPEEIIFNCNHVWVKDGRTTLTFEAKCKVGNSSQRIMDLTKHGAFNFLLHNAAMNKDDPFNPNAIRAAYSNASLNEQSRMMINNINTVTKEAFIKFLTDKSSDETKVNLKKDLPVGDEFFKYMNKDDYEAIIKFVELCKKQNVDLNKRIKGNDWTNKEGYINYKFYFGKNTAIADNKHHTIALADLLEKRSAATVKIFLPTYTISFKGEELSKFIEASYVVHTMEVFSIKDKGY